MRVAVAAEGNRVTEHFGHCEGFKIFEVDRGQVMEGEYIPNPGHQPGFLPGFLSDLGVNVVIAGGMGSRAIQLFKEKGIAVITGASGNVDETIDDYARGRLVTSESACSH